MPSKSTNQNGRVPGLRYRGDDLSASHELILASIAVSVSVPIFSSRRQDAQVKAVLQVESFSFWKAMVLNETHGQIPCFWRLGYLCWINASVFIQTKANSQYRESAQTMLQCVYQQRWRFFRMCVQARIATLNGAYRILELFARALKRLAELNYVDDTRLKRWSSNEKNSDIVVICIRCVSSVAGLSTWFFKHSIHWMAKWTQHDCAMGERWENCPCTCGAPRTQIIAAPKPGQSPRDGPYPFLWAAQGFDNSSVAR